MNRVKTIFVALGVFSFFVLLCLFAVRYFSGTAVPNIEPRRVATTGSVTGRIVSGPDKNPVAQAKIAIGGKTVYSKEDGSFLVMELPVSSHNLVVTSGSNTWTGSVTVVKGGTVTVPEIILPSG